MKMILLLIIARLVTERNLFSYFIDGLAYEHRLVLVNLQLADEHRLVLVNFYSESKGNQILPHKLTAFY